MFSSRTLEERNYVYLTRMYESGHKRPKPPTTDSETDGKSPPSRDCAEASRIFARTFLPRVPMNLYRLIASALAQSQMEMEPRQLIKNCVSEEARTRVLRVRKVPPIGIRYVLE